MYRSQLNEEYTFAIIKMETGERGSRNIIWLGKYRIESMLGGAGSGEVFLAEHVKLQVKRIIKRIRKTHPFYEQVAGEADILRQLQHPGIPQLYDVEEDEQYLYLIEEFINGISIKNVVLSDRLEEYQIVSIALHICNIIQYLHQQEPPIYYLDLKPEHVLISGNQVRLIDFGSAVQTERGVPPGQLLCLGTAGYAPPELYRDGQVNSYSDVYGIGSVIYFLMTGAIYPDAWEKSNVGKRAYTGRLWKIVRKCMQPEAKDRCSLGELIRALEKRDRSQKRNQKKIVSCGKRTIGLMGTHPGTGVTHISLLLTYYLAGITGKPIAYVEYNHHGDCGRLVERGTERRLCGILGREVTFFADVSATDLSRILNERYAYYVIDFGSEWEERLTEYLRCECKIVVAQLTEWRLDDLEQLESQEQKDFRQETWHYLYNLNDDRQVRASGRTGMSFPWESDIRHPTARAARIFAQLLQSDQ